MILAEEAASVSSFVDALNAQDCPVLVEGMRDERALRDLGFSGTILVYHRFGGPAAFSDHAVRYSRIILLLDRDREGREIKRRLAENLCRRTTLDSSYSAMLAKITRGRIRHVEDMRCYVRYLLGPDALVLKGLYDPADR